MILWKVCSGGAGSPTRVDTTAELSMWEWRVDCLVKILHVSTLWQIFGKREKCSIYPWQKHNTKLIAQKLILNYRHFAFRFYDLNLLLFVMFMELFLCEWEVADAIDVGANIIYIIVGCLPLVRLIHLPTSPEAFCFLHRQQLFGTRMLFTQASIKR